MFSSYLEDLALVRLCVHLSKGWIDHLELVVHQLIKKEYFTFIWF